MILFERILVTFIFSVCLGLVLQAQPGDIMETNNAKESLQVAQELIANEEFEQAIKQLEHTIKIKEDFAVAYRLLGKIFYDDNRFAEAKTALEKSFDLDKKLSRAAFFECGDACIRLGEIDQAKYYLGLYDVMKDKRYANSNKESGLEKSYDAILEMKHKNIEYVNNLDYSSTLEIVAIDKINSKHDEYLPCLSNDGQFMLFTRNIAKKQEDIMLSKITKDGWGNEKAGDIELNTSENEGMAKFEPHNYKVYYAACKSNQQEEINCDIYESAFIEGVLGGEKPLEGAVNSPSWDSQPAVTCDAQSLFFASTRAGGMGGSDIWVSHKDKNGNWGRPENMGEHINTAGDEEAPFIAKDGRSLYFTSDGHPGQGEGDFFVSFNKNGNWTASQNMGYPLNSPSKELGLYISDDGEKIYFASARQGGKGGLDIYMTDLPEELKPDIVLPVVLNLRDAETDEALTGVITVGYDNVRTNYETDNQGNVQLCIAGSKAYSFRVKIDGYKFYVEAFFLEEQSENQIQNIKLAIEKDVKKPYVGEDRHTKTIVQVYFDKNSAEIGEKNSKKLINLSELMNKYDDWNINVIGFADHTGDADYNKKLSEQRAEAVVGFLANYSTKSVTQKVNLLGKGSVGNGLSEDELQKSRRVDVILTR